MVSKRLKFISSLINKDDKILDIGTDHALLPIYLVKNNITDIAVLMVQPLDISILLIEV